MKHSITVTWIALLVLTIAVSIISTIANEWAIVLILAFSFLKFTGIAFYFMELKKAHIFWKLALLLFLGFFYILIWSTL